MHGRGCRVPRRGVPHVSHEYSADDSTESGFFVKPGDFVEIAGVGRVVFARVRGWSLSVPVPAGWCRFLQSGAGSCRVAALRCRTAVGSRVSLGASDRWAVGAVEL